MSSLGLNPDQRLIIQSVIFLAALVSANHFMIKPALRLHAERKRRTSGAIDMAKAEVAKAEGLEASYNRELKARTEEARNLRLSEVLAGQAEAEAMLANAQEQARLHVAQIQKTLEANVAQERAKLPSLLDQTVEAIFAQLVGGTSKAIAGVLITGTLFLGSMTARAAQDTASTPGGFSFADSIFWPYFQFLVFVAALVYFGRKGVANLLESRRESLRTKLSEARQAVTLAERKTDEYERKIALLQKEIEEMRTQNIDDGVKERSKIVSDAQQMAVQIVRDAERAASELITRSKEELRKELVDLAVSTVEARMTAERVAVLDKKLKVEALASIKVLSAH